MVLKTNSKPAGPAIGVIGVGTVGGAVRSYFRERGFPVYCYDRYSGLGSIDEVNQAEVIFICVPTPYVDGRGLDPSAVEDAVSVIHGSKTVVLKSTSLPGTTERLQAQYRRHRFFFNPEFLRESRPLQDFLDPDRQLMGYCNEADRETAQGLLQLLPRAPYEAALPSTAAEMIKLLTNSYLALRVIFANQVYDLTSRIGVDYEEVRQGLAADPRIGNSHFNVFDGGYRGYGGKCLPKDTGGVIDFARACDAPQRLLEAAHAINRELTGDRRSEALEAPEIVWLPG